VRDDLPTGTVTFLFTDVEGSTKLLRELGAEAYAQALAEHRGIVREACSTHGGVEVDTQGDAFFLVFRSAPGAVAAAQAITEKLAPGLIRLRIGVHTGTPLVTNEGYVGDDVHLAGRVAASGHGGQVVLSQATRALLDGISLTDLGEHRLKDVETPVNIFQLGNTRFPPLKTISNSNLPRPASSFVGREAELTEMLGLLENGARLVTLTGPGGSGKTRLALEAAATLVPSYKAGVFWISFASLRDPSLVTTMIAHTLGANDGLATHVGEREMLLLLDNLEQVIEAAPELSLLLSACPNLTLLVTSRELLRVQGEVEYPVPPLAEPEAVSLFCERSQLEPSGQIADLCARLDNLPLAVELAAARAKALSPAQILDRLEHRLDLLRGGRDADPRQQTLRATIEWSYDLLPNDEEQLFRRLSVFAGGCTLEAAEEVAEAAIDSLQSLVEKNLVRFIDERFSMLETIREYAGERLAESDELNEVRMRHAEHLVALAERAEPKLRTAEQTRWHERLEREVDNFRAAIAWTREVDNGDFEVRLAASLWQFWHVHGHYEEAVRQLASALERKHGSPETQAKILGGLTFCAARIGDLEGAEAWAEERLRVSEASLDDVAIAKALNGLAIVASEREHFGHAVKLSERALVHARSTGDGPLIANLLSTIGHNLVAGGALERGLVFLREALDQLKAIGDRQGQAMILWALGHASLTSGSNAEGRRLLQQSLRIAKELRFAQPMPGILLWAASARIIDGNVHDAVVLVAAAESVVAETGTSLDREERDRLKSTLFAASRHLSEVEQEALLEKGRQMPLDDALELALASMG
jgi:predicted ATPase